MFKGNSLLKYRENERLVLFSPELPTTFLAVLSLVNFLTLTGSFLVI